MTTERPNREDQPAQPGGYVLRGAGPTESAGGGSHFASHALIGGPL